MKNKRLLVAQALMRLGCGPLARFMNRDRLVIFNYHRIRADEFDTHNCFDSGVFGPSQQMFRDQLVYLQKHSTILSQRDLLKILSGQDPGKGPFSMVTFDDAYIDNYHLALPVLKELGVPAIFFIPATVIEKRDLGWWDKISFIVKNSQKSELFFRGEKLFLGLDVSASIEKLCNIIKLTPGIVPLDVVEELSMLSESPVPSKEAMDKELMTWEQLKEAHDNGIALGSHTCSHRVLATLSEEEQAREIIDSKIYLENKLNVEIKTLAFPVGGLEHFNDVTLKLVEKAGYDAAFSFNTGTSIIGNLNKFAIPRLGAPDDLQLFKATVTFPEFMDFNSRHRRSLNKSLY